MAFKMKGSPMLRNFGISPLNKGKTRFVDKVKAFGGAIAENFGKVHGHGGHDTLTHNTYRTYKRKKREYREKAAAPTKDIGTHVRRVVAGAKALKARVTGKGDQRRMGETPSGGPFDPKTYKKIAKKVKKILN